MDGLSINPPSSKFCDWGIAHRYHQRIDKTIQFTFVRKIKFQCKKLSLLSSNDSFWFWIVARSKVPNDLHMFHIVLMVFNAPLCHQFVCSFGYCPEFKTQKPFGSHCTLKCSGLGILQALSSLYPMTSEMWWRTSAIWCQSAGVVQWSERQYLNFVPECPGFQSWQQFTV